MIVRRLLTDMLQELRSNIFQISNSDSVIKVMLWFVFIFGISLLSATTPQANAKPSWGYGLNRFPPPRRSLDTAGVKPYTGRRISNDTLRMIYWHDQTVAVVELGPKKLLLNCELIEVYDDADGQLLRRQLSRINRPLEITFDQMVKLMSQCQEVEGVGSLPKPQQDVIADEGAEGTSPEAGKSNADTRSEVEADTQAPARPPSASYVNSFSWLSGIIPGTLWCGTGDIARNYFALGYDRAMDRCCRTHDLCPVKVRRYSERYNLINKSLYSKSHCCCDDLLFSCLKITNTTSAQLMGHVYFNIVAVDCIQDLPDGRREFRAAKKGF